MPSPWVTRALRQELPLTDRQSGRSYSSPTAGTYEADIRNDERTALAVTDSRQTFSAIDADPADAYGSIRALRAFGIVR